MKSKAGRLVAALAAAVMLLSGALMLTTGAATAQQSGWRAEYYTNSSLSGSPSIITFEPDISNYWGVGAPYPGMPADNFSVRWTQTFNVPGGSYRIAATMDDGMRVYVDGVPIIDSWTVSTRHTVSRDVTLGAGEHDVVVEYFEAAGEATAVLTFYQLSSGGSGGSGGGFGGGSGQPPIGGGNGGDLIGSYPNWKGEYFRTIDLTGAPALVRDDRYINFNWGENRVIEGMPKDYWSARWTRTGFYPAGTYRFTVDSDDGSRIYVNNQLIMDNWDNPSLTPVIVDYYHPGGQATVRVEYYDRLVNARMIMNVTQIGSGGSGGGFGGGSATILQCPGVPYPTGFNAVVISSSNLNVRRAPTTTSEVMGQIPSCDTIQLTGSIDASGQWAQLFYEGQLGWVATQYLVTGVPLSSFSSASG